MVDFATDMLKSFNDARGAGTAVQALEDAYHHPSASTSKQLIEAVNAAEKAYQAAADQCGVLLRQLLERS
jgi:hypothetical protein